MEFIQKIWIALSTENESLINTLSIPLVFLETAIGVLLFVSILNIHATQKQKILYVLLSSCFTIFSRLIIPDPYGVMINFLFFTFLVMFIFKVKLLKAVICPLFPAIVIVLTESALLKICLSILKIDFNTMKTVAIYRIPYVLSVYFISFLIYRASVRLKINLNFLDNISHKNKILLLINFIFVFIYISIQIYLITFYSNNLPIIVTFFSIASLLTYFIISIYSLTRTTQLQLANENLEEEKLYNKTLVMLHDNIRGFKHDFNNIVSVIGGYVASKDMDGLTKYYSQLLEDCQKINNLAILSPTIINNSAIYSLLSSKYHQACELGIKMNIEVFLDLNTIEMKIYEFTRILGILLDNAIEASDECDEKIINLTIRKDSNSNRQLCIIENTYVNKEIDTEKIFEKGFSTKNRNSGIGLWEIRQFLKKLSNVNLYTSKDSKMFKQQLEIYV